jgi:SMI1 / KNR4 family (SUKH-1)
MPRLGEADWRALAERARLELRPPAADTALESAAQDLGHALPETLRSLYAVSDGLVDEYGTAYVMGVSELVEENELMRGDAGFPFLYMPFDSLVFVGKLGDGDLLGCPVLADGPREDVFVWDHENDSRSWYAPDLVGAIERYCST